MLGAAGTARETCREKNLQRSRGAARERPRKGQGKDGEKLGRDWDEM